MVTHGIPRMVVSSWIPPESVRTNFELDISEQTTIITNILKYCGIIIRDPEIVQSAQAEAQQVEINEKS